MSKFLIVDDSPIERYTLRKCLEKLKHEVVAEAKNGLEALGFYKKFMPDIVILDIVMPNDNGIDILEQLINYDKNAKVIMCTSAATQTAVINASRLGAKYFLAKPINIESLSQIIQKILSQSI